jgi:hypothetical protein
MNDMFIAIAALFLVTGCDAVFRIDHVGADGDARTDGDAGVSVVPALTATGYSSGTAVASLSFMMTISPGAARLLIVSIEISSAGAPPPAVSSVSYAGMPASLLDTVASSEARSEQWELIAPPIGTGQALVELAAPSAAIRANGMAFASVNQATPVRAVAHGGGSAASASVTVLTANGDLVESTVGQGTGIAGPASLEGSGAFLDNGDAGYALNNAAGSTALGLAPSITMGWTFVGTDIWQMIAASLEPEVASTSAAAVR